MLLTELCYHGVDGSPCLGDPQYSAVCTDMVYQGIHHVMSRLFSDPGKNHILVELRGNIVEAQKQKQ